MTTIDVTRDTRSGNGQIESPRWQENKNCYRVRVFICPEEDGLGFYAYAANIPGLASDGNTFDEALANVRDAAKAVLSSYLAHGEQIPNEPCEDSRPNGCIERWISVNA